MGGGLWIICHVSHFIADTPVSAMMDTPSYQCHRVPTAQATVG